MPANYSITTRTTGEVLTAAKYNADHQNHIDNAIPTIIDDYSGDVTTMRTKTDPGEVGTESQATSLAGEIARLRYAIYDAKLGVDPTIVQWYETPVPTTVQNVLAYGAVGDGVTNDRAAIQSAITAACTTGGGTVYFPRTASGVYYLGTSVAGNVSLPIPAANATTYATETQSIPYMFYIQNITGLRIIGEGVTIKSGYTSGGNIFTFDGCRDLLIDGITVQGVTVLDGSGTPTTTGQNGLCFTSTTQDSERILIQNTKVTNAYTSYYFFGDGAGSYRIRGAVIQNGLTVDSYYGIACHNNCDNLTAKAYRTTGGNRSYFVYGVQNHDVQVTVTGGTSAFNAILVKAYDYNTENIHLQVKFARTTSSVKAQFQSQHHPATQATPAKVRNVIMDYSEVGYSGGGGVDFAYYQDNSVQATSSASVFDNIILKGIYENDITTQTVFSGAGRVKLNIDDVIFISGSPSILNGNGFYTQAHNTYTPVLKIGGSTTGITYTTQSGSYWQVGNLVFGHLEVLLSNKGAQTGAVTITLPLTITSVSSRVPVFQVMGYTGMNGLTGALSAWGSTNTTTANIVQSGATAVAAITDTELTNTSRIFLSFFYSK